MGTFIEAIGWVFFGACGFIFAAWIVTVILHYLNK